MPTLPTSNQPAWQTYGDELAILGHGLALWEPAPLYNYRYNKINIGDVGYIRQGRFHLLFSAAMPLGVRRPGEDLPPNFVPFEPGPTVRNQPRLPGAIHSNYIEQKSVAFNASSTPTSIEFWTSSTKGAILVTRYKTFREDAERLGRFKDYMWQHHQSWVDHANRLGHLVALDDILFVTGHDMTLDFAMLAFSSNSKPFGIEFSASASAVGSTSATVWGKWRTSTSVHHNSGPQRQDPHADLYLLANNAHSMNTLPEYNQCIFLRGYRMRRRAYFIPKVIRAAAGPHDLGSGRRFDEAGPQVECNSTTSNSDPEIIAVPDSLFVDPLKPVFDYVFDNSNTDSVIIHDSDISDLIKDPGAISIKDINGLVSILSPQMINVDKNGLASICPMKDSSRNSGQLQTSVSLSENLRTKNKVLTSKSQVYEYPTRADRPNNYTIVNNNITSVDIPDADIGVVNIIKAIILSVNAFTASQWNHYSEGLKMLKNSSEKLFALVESRFIYKKEAFHAFFGPPVLHSLGPDSVIILVTLRELRTYKNAKYREELHRASNWNMVFDVPVHADKGNSNFKFEFTRASFDETSSSFGFGTTGQTLFLKLGKGLVQYIKWRYFQLEVFDHMSKNGISVNVVKGQVEEIVKEREGRDGGDLKEGREAVITEGYGERGHLGVKERERVSVRGEVKVWEIVKEKVEANLWEEVKVREDDLRIKHINMQLEHIWELANEYALKHCHELKPSNPEIEYRTCLAQFGVGIHKRHNPSKHDLDFFASFGIPQLESIQNREALFKLQLNHGHYKLVDEPSRNWHTFQKHTCIFRILYEEKTIRDTKPFMTTAIVLDFSKITCDIITEEGSGENDHHHKAIATYLEKHYFPILAKAGLDFFPSIPYYFPIPVNNIPDGYTIFRNDITTIDGQLQTSVSSNEDLRIKDKVLTSGSHDYGCPTPADKPNSYTIVNNNITSVDIPDADIGVVNIIKAIILSVNEYTAAQWNHYSEELKILKNSSEKHFIFVESRFIYEKTAFHAFFGPPVLHPSGPDSVIIDIKLQELRAYKDAEYRGESLRVSNRNVVFDVSVHANKDISNFKFDFARASFIEKRSSLGFESTGGAPFSKLSEGIIQYIKWHYFQLEVFDHMSKNGINVNAVNEQVEEIDGKENEGEDLKERWEVNVKEEYKAKEYLGVTEQDDVLIKEEAKVVED